MKKLFLLFLISILLITSCGKDLSKQIEKLHIGLDQKTTYKIMGKPDDTEDLEYYFVAYWFDGASSIKDAEEKTADGYSIKYYCVIFSSQDGETYEIVKNEDYFSGYWGKD